jgi:hypothetical protein
LCQEVPGIKNIFVPTKSLRPLIKLGL